MINREELIAAIDDLKAELADANKKISMANNLIYDLKCFNNRLISEIDEIYEWVADLRHTIRNNE